ncbi:hypothetical protein KWE28_14480 [Acinetobacter pittii]|nr:hypothetical protein [Acinetobacter pittii]SSV78869.1 Uncharacterised protein [Acinetobacter pittii]
MEIFLAIVFVFFLFAAKVDGIAGGIIYTVIITAFLGAITAINIYG